MKPFTAKERKERPVYSGVLRYFPKALLEIARVSYAGNEQHHPGKPLHWDRAKSTDEADALVRHLLEAGTLDTDGLRHTAKAAWRCLALLEKELEGEDHIADAGKMVETTSRPKLTHCERIVAAKDCAGGCGVRTYPETTCRKCRGKASGVSSARPPRRDRPASPTSGSGTRALKQR